MPKEPPGFESFDQMAETTAAGLVQAGAHQAFQLFRDKEFRRLANFDILSQGEQDRIFNELVVSYVVLIMLEAPDLRVPPEFRNYLLALKEKIPAAHLDYLKGLGVEAEHLQGWGKLVDMRHAEYAKDRHEVRAAAMELESAEKPLDLDDLSKIQMLVPVQAVAIGCHDHVCRGQTQGRDDLFKLTLRALSRFYVDIRIRMEGGKINPLTRARVAWKRVIHRQGKRGKVNEGFWCSSRLSIARGKIEATRWTKTREYDCRFAMAVPRGFTR